MAPLAILIWIFFLNSNKKILNYFYFLPIFNRPPPQPIFHQNQKITPWTKLPIRDNGRLWRRWRQKNLRQLGLDNAIVKENVRILIESVLDPDGAYLRVVCLVPDIVGPPHIRIVVARVGRVAEVDQNPIQLVGDAFERGRTLVRIGNERLEAECLGIGDEVREFAGVGEVEALEVDDERVGRRLQ